MHALFKKIRNTASTQYIAVRVHVVCRMICVRPNLGLYTPVIVIKTINLAYFEHLHCFYPTVHHQALQAIIQKSHEWAELGC